MTEPLDAKIARLKLQLLKAEEQKAARSLPRPVTEVIAKYLDDKHFTTGARQTRGNTLREFFAFAYGNGYHLARKS